MCTYAFSFLFLCFFFFFSFPEFPADMDHERKVRDSKRLSVDLKPWARHSKPNRPNRLKRYRLTWRTKDSVHFEVMSRFVFFGGGRPYFLLAMAWGLSASTWRGRKLTLGRWNDGCNEALQHWRCTQGHPRVQELSIVGQYCSDQQPSLQESQVHRKARTSPVQSSHLILLPHSCTPTMHRSPRL